MNRHFVALLGTATGLNLAWAGAVTFRVLIDLPARHRIGPVAFAEFSRATDLSGGLVFYPVVAIGSALLSFAVWLMAARIKAPRSIRLQAAAAAMSATLVLGVTTVAAPIMFRIGTSPDDPAVLLPLADRFASLTNVRALFADIGALALLSA